MVRVVLNVVAVAQLVEHWIVAPGVAGSNPVGHPIEKAEESAATTDSHAPDFGQPVANRDPVESALAEAIGKATEAGEWLVVAQLARELEARRLARAQVPELLVERARRWR